MRSRRRPWRRQTPLRIAASILLLGSAGILGCDNHAQRGAVIGAAVGAAADGERGAFVGGVTGYIIGNEIDKKHGHYN